MSAQAAFAADAKEEKKKGGDHVTKTLTVTAARVERDLREIPMTVNVITAEEIKKNPAATVEEILSRTPGMELSYGGVPGAPKIKIRGASQMQTAVFIDGVRYSDPLPIADMSMPIMLSPADIERIEVIKGPSSVLYGSDAIGGVVNIITKKQSASPLNARVQGTYDSSAKRHDQYFSVTGEYEGVFYKTSANFNNAKNLSTPEGKVTPTDYDKFSYAGSLGYKWDKGRVSFSVDRYNSDINYLVGSEANVKWDKYTYSADLVLERLSAHFARLAINAAYRDINKQSATSLAARDRDVAGASASIQTDWTLGDHYLITGVLYDYDKMESSTFPSSLYPSGRQEEGKSGAFAVFAQDEWRVLDDLALTVGLRQTWYETELTRSQRANAENKKTDHNLVGSVGAVYTGFDDVSLRAQFSEGYRVPNLYELYVGSGVMLQANPDLKPEKSYNWETGIMLQKYGFMVDLSLFYSKANDYITTEYVADTRRRYVNVGKAETYGAELTAEYAIKDFTPYADVACLDRTFWYNSGKVGKTNKSGTPPLSGSLGLKWEKKINKFSLFADANAKWADGVDFEDHAGNITDYHGWTTYNLQIGLSKGEFFSSIALNNLTNRSYHTAGNKVWHQPGRHVVLTVGYTF